jgi:DNA-binding MarR family transcriptional regulator
MHSTPEPAAHASPSQHSSQPDDRRAQITRAQLQRLAEFRFQLRRFLHFSNAAADRSGLRAQQYQLLQCVYGMPDELDPTIANVAARMFLKHNSAVELVDRTIDLGYLRRCPDPTDHRRILLRLTTQGERLLNSLAEFHLEELEQTGPELIRALRRVLSMKGEPSVPESPAVLIRKSRKAG